MEPDVMRLYSSSPPPLDEGPEEDDDEFGDFGGFGGALATSFSFSELETPSLAFNQSQASDNAPPEFPIGSLAPGAHKVSAVGWSAGSDSLRQPADKAHVESARDPRASDRSEGRTEVGSLYINGDVADPEPLANGFPETDAQDASVDTAAAALSFGSPCGQHGSEKTDHRDTSQHKVTSGEGTSLANGFTELHMHTKQEHRAEASPMVAPEEQESFSDSDSKDEGTSVESHGPPSSGLHTESSEPGTQTQSGFAERPASPSSTSQDGVVLLEGQDLENDFHPAEEELPTPSGRTRTSESDDFASFCEVVSQSDLEEFGEFGDFSSTAPATASEGPAADAPDEDDFGGFREAGTHSTQGFADFSQTESSTQEGGFASFPTDCPPAHCDAPSEADEKPALPLDAPGNTGAEHAEDGSSIQGEQFGELSVSDSFADFQSVPVGGGEDAGEEWAAFGEPPADEQAGGGGGGWAAFGEEQTQTDQTEVEEPQWQDGAAVPGPSLGSPHTSRRDSVTASVSSRVQRLFQVSFPHAEAHPVGEEIPSLKALLEPQEPDSRQEHSNQPPFFCSKDMWRHLQDIHSAFGLKFLWGGSHSNRQLLHCLAMDTRNIVFSGQKKQPVIVPVYAASLGMLEPTKDPVKATSAAGPVAASAQSPPGAPDGSAPSKSTQEVLASAQPDWSSSGLKPPADGSSQPQPQCQSLPALELNLDYFGPVEDSSSGSSTPPAGVDPELYELTTVTMESKNTGKRITDAFTRLMSTIEQNSTSTRRPVRDENLSEEAARVLSVLPDLSFMRAKVLMFPSVLAPQPPS